MTLEYNFESENDFTKYLKMSCRSLPTTTLLIFCKIIGNSKVIVYGIKDPDNNGWMNSRALMVKLVSGSITFQKINHYWCTHATTEYLKKSFILVYFNEPD